MQSIKAHLFYDIKQDEVIGLEDMGDKKSVKPALNVLCIMIKGIYNNWKQPFSYYFVHSTCSYVELKNILENTFKSLTLMGLKIRVFTGDMGSSNISLSKFLGITTVKPFFEIDNSIRHIS